MNKKKFIIIIVFGIVHFIISIISIFNGMTIFSGPKTNSEIFWSFIMNITLFPLNILLRNLSFANQWMQTLIILLNSLICGSFFSILNYLITKNKMKKTDELKRKNYKIYIEAKKISRT